MGSSQHLGVQEGGTIELTIGEINGRDLTIGEIGKDWERLMEISGD